MGSTECYSSNGNVSVDRTCLKIDSQVLDCLLSLHSVLALFIELSMRKASNKKNLKKRALVSIDILVKLPQGTPLHRSFVAILPGSATFDYYSKTWRAVHAKPRKDCATDAEPNPGPSSRWRRQQGNHKAFIM